MYVFIEFLFDNVLYCEYALLNLKKVCIMTKACLILAYRPTAPDVCVGASPCGATT